MWQLICDHRYSWGTIAVDLSPWGSDGVPSSVAPLPDASALRFSTPQSQVAIPRRANDPWSVLGAIAVEITARFLMQATGTLIDADQSFRLRVDGGTMTGEIPGQQVDTGNVIPAGRWMRMRFRHNGFNGIGFGFETLGEGPGFGGGGASPIPYSQVPPVGPKGILIGNRIGASSQHMQGDIASVRVWRSDPRSMGNEFLARPLDPALSACWTEFLRRLEGALRNNPKCAEWLTGAIAQLQQKFLQALAQKGQAKIEEFRQMCREYRELWRAGLVGSPQMKALLARLRDWLKTEGLLSADDPALVAIGEHPCMATLAGLLPSLDCDPEIKALIEALIGPT